ncbi:MAG: hypothetical protein IT444_05990 [Phycisphaeraceae bacterium]|nr:hypothetical protein [Phycisphaeraceae bacterium]
MSDPTISHADLPLVIDQVHREWLFELTTLPTASGREDRVIEWVQRWAQARRNVQIKADRHGNIVLTRVGARSSRPIFFTAHMDHPAFVVVKVLDARRVLADFRGGVNDNYFVGSSVSLHPPNLHPQHGKVEAFENQTAHSKAASEGAKRLRIVFKQDVTTRPGDVVTWDVKIRQEGDRIFVPACDDLAGVAAALSAFDAILAKKPIAGAKGKGINKQPDVRVLLTRAEEIGFIGAIAACKSKTIPKGARVVALENSRSYPDSPIGAGPIVRVGDYTSTFDPDLTYRIGKIAMDLATQEPTFKWQRKLMPGGTCEASVYQTYGYTASCICLALGNYHNMNEVTGRIDAESISLADYHGLVHLLVAIAERLDDPAKAPGLRVRLEDLFLRRKFVLE